MTSKSRHCFRQVKCYSKSKYLHLGYQVIASQVGLDPDCLYYNKSTDLNRRDTYMTNDQSLIYYAQEFMNASILNKIHQINESEEAFEYDKNHASSLHAFLNDRSTLITPDFVLRRHIQSKIPHLLTDREEGGMKDGIDYDDLTRFGNLHWDKKDLGLIATRVSEHLYQMSVQNHRDNPLEPVIIPFIWFSYLTSRRPPDHNHILMIAVMLQMDVETTQEYFLACGENGYSAQNPLDMICYYCQQQKGSYSWSKVQELLKRYLTAAEKAPVPSLETSELASELAVLLGHGSNNAGLSADLQDEKLIRLMAEYSDQFLPCSVEEDGTIWPKADSARDFSQTNWLYYMRLLQYLGVLYPKVEWKTVRNGMFLEYAFPVPEYSYFMHNQTYHSQNNLDSHRIVRDLRWGPSGLPNLEDLLSAMYYRANWDFSNLQDKAWGILDKQERSKNLFYFDDSEEFQFCLDYYGHARAILEDKYKKFHSDIGRKDILFLGYFFLRSILELPSSEWYMKYVELIRGEHLFRRKLAPSDKDLVKLVQPFDEAMMEILDLIQDAGDLQDVMHRCLDILLRQFGFLPLYLPSVFDRFVRLSLMMDSSDFPLPLLLLLPFKTAFR